MLSFANDTKIDKKIHKSKILAAVYRRRFLDLWLWVRWWTGYSFAVSCFQKKPGRYTFFNVPAALNMGAISSGV